MKADGSIIIDTKILDGGMEKGFELIKDEMASVGITAKKVGEQTALSFSKIDVSRPIANAISAVEKLEQKMQTALDNQKDAKMYGDARAEQTWAGRRIDAYNRLEEAREKLALELELAVRKEAAAEERAAQQAQKAAERKAAAEERAAQQAIKAAEKETKAKQRETEKQMNNALKPAKRFGTRLSEILSGALFYNLISAGVRELTSYFGAALKTNEQYNKSLSQLKGAFLTAFQPIYEYVVPAIVYLMQLLTAAAQAIGQFFASVTGQSYKDMQKNAEAMYKQANGIGAVGAAAKEAKKQLMGFDELNKLNSQDTDSGGSASSAQQPTFGDFDDTLVKGKLDDILRVVGAIAAALLTWKISSLFTSSLATAAGLAIAVGGAVMYATSWADAFANGIDWGNLSGMLLGMAAIAGGLALAFGPVGAAVGLLVTSIGLVVLAIKDWIETGELSDEACAALVLGIVGIGAAISILIGGPIPLLIAAIVAFVLAAKEKGDEMKQIFAKVVQWFKDTFLKDWTEVFGPGLGGELNSFFLMCADILDGLEQVFGGLIDFIQNAFAGNWDAAWEGLATAAKGAVNVLISIINGMIRTVTTGINALFRLLSFSIELPNGESIGWQLPQFEAPQIPYLAKGAVLPPNKPFLAMVGDQKNGTNIEAPLATIEQALRNVMAEQGFDVNVEFRGELAALARVLAPVITKEQRRTSRAGGY